MIDVMMKSMTIPLRSGLELDVDVTPEFMSKVANHFNVSQGLVTAEHVKMFIWEIVKHAIDKHENEEKNI